MYKSDHNSLIASIRNPLLSLDRYDLFNLHKGPPPEPCPERDESSPHNQDDSVQFKLFSLLSLSLRNNFFQAQNKTKKKLRGLSPQPRTIPTERPPLVGEVSANFSG
jgi:hypothetical protein